MIILSIKWILFGPQLNKNEEPLIQQISVIGFVCLALIVCKFLYWGAYSLLTLFLSTLCQCLVVHVNKFLTEDSAISIIKKMLFWQLLQKYHYQKF